MLSRITLRPIFALRMFSSQPPFFPEKKGEAPKDSTWPEPKKMPMNPGTPNPSSMEPLESADRVEALGLETLQSEFV